MPERTPGRLTTIKAAAARLEVTEITIRRMISRGELAAYRLGPRSVRLDADEVDRLLTPIPVGTTAGYTPKRGR